MNVNLLHTITRSKINKLKDNDLFGEIAMLTNLKRTCSVIADETCLLQSLSRESLQQVQDMFPSIFQNVYDNMYDYNDENMVQRRQFLNNIPYLKGLGPQILT